MAGVALYANSNVLAFVNQQIRTVLNKSGVLNQSSADLYIENQTLKITPHITDKDREDLNPILNRAGLSEDILNGMTLNLDQNSIDNLSKVLPISVNLEISDKKISYSTFNLMGMKNALPTKEFKIATDGAELTYRSNQSSYFYIKAESPDILLKDATKSGQVILSPSVVESGLKILPDVSTIEIEIEINGKVMKGEILFR